MTTKEAFDIVLALAFDNMAVHRSGQDASHGGKNSGLNVNRRNTGAVLPAWKDRDPMGVLDHEEQRLRDQPHVTMIQIDRLGRDKASAMIRDLAGGKELPTEVLEPIISKTDGVPLFIEELTKMVLESGLLRDAGDRYITVGPLRDFAIPTDDSSIPAGRPPQGSARTNHGSHLNQGATGGD
jgi:hypothetical protein